MIKTSRKNRIAGQEGQAAVESIFSVLLILLLMLASGQVLYTSLIVNEAAERAHKSALEYFRDMNAKGNELFADYEELVETVEVSPGRAYALVVNGWTLFHKDHKPGMTPHAKFSGGEMYRATRSIFIAAGPLKGPGGQVNGVGEGRSAFGVPEGGGMFPSSDGDGYNNSGKALRNDAFEELVEKMEIPNSYF